MGKFKQIFLTLCKYLGLFHLTGYLSRDKLNILCYHGFAYEDESLFSPGLFMTPQTLEKRLAWLSKHEFKVFDLEEGIERLYARRLPPKSVVITIDDGFRSVGELAAPVFLSYKMPATLYVTSYYVKKETPIFRLIMQYMSWKSGPSATSVLALVKELPEEEQEIIDSFKEPIWQLIDYGEHHLTEEQRVSLSKKVALHLQLDYEHIRDTGMMTLMTEREIKMLRGMGIDVQLHTHRHTLPNEVEAVEREISQNRVVLEPLLGKKLRHFCYPSGVWNRNHWPMLERLGIDTATTCDPGLNDHSGSPFGLKRFLDRENTSQIEFEAELYGFKELLRRIRTRFSRRHYS